jgi:hypothetical protein
MEYRAADAAPGNFRIVTRFLFWPTLLPLGHTSVVRQWRWLEWCQIKQVAVRCTDGKVSYVTWEDREWL